MTAPALSLVRGNGQSVAGAPNQAPPMRAQADVPDPMLDGNRAAYFTNLWHAQDDVLRPRDRQIEENIRMLCGQQWTVWNPVLAKWINVQEWFGDPDRYWRQRPVVNRLLYWFILTHARMTENPPIVTFQPSNADRSSAQLADVMDTLYKTIWLTAGMDDAIDNRAAWLIPCGEAYVLSRIDPDRGPLKPWIGPAMLPLTDQLGQPVAYPAGHPQQGQPIEAYAPGVPYNQAGQPQAKLNPDGTYEATGEPYMEPTGEIVVDALCPLQVRGEWSQRPWHRRKWHMMFAYMSLDEVRETFNMELPAEAEGDTGSKFELSRILMGSGWYGAMGGRPGSDGLVTNFKGGYAGVYTYWERPSKAFPVSSANPSGGRMWIGTRTTTIYDGPRNAAFPYTSPLRQYRFVNLPGRPGATTPQEAMNPLQRQYNRGWAQIMEYRNLCVNPVGVIDQVSGVRDKDIVNKPGLLVTAIKRPGVKVLEYVDPPKLGEEVFRTQELLRKEMQDFGNIEGAEGSAPTVDASGELVKELRFNSDRFIAPTQRRNTVEDGRLVEDHICLSKVIFDEPTILTYTGDDNLTQTVAVLPEIFSSGKVKVVPITESALPEGRSERVQRAQAMFQMGVWGQPGIDPKASEAFLDMARFPHMGRAQMLGGVDQVTASQENGQLVLGIPANQIETYEWMDHNIHLAVHTKYMSTPEFKKLDPQKKMAFVLHRQQHQQIIAQEQAAQLQQQVAIAQLQSHIAAKSAPPSAPPGNDAGAAPAQPPAAA